METLTLIIIGISLFLMLTLFLLISFKKKRQHHFKLIIEKGIITTNTANVPVEFLYDTQQLARIYKPDYLIINGRHINAKTPIIIFKGVISLELQTKLEQSLILSLK
jgi:hypothetical protein